MSATYVHSGAPSHKSSHATPSPFVQQEPESVHMAHLGLPPAAPYPSRGAG